MKWGRIREKYQIKLPLLGKIQQFSHYFIDIRFYIFIRKCTFLLYICFKNSNPIQFHSLNQKLGIRKQKVNNEDGLLFMPLIDRFGW